jgi:hypothetical protein
MTLEDSQMFSTAISKIWLVGLVLFALTPFLIAARPPAQETQVEKVQPTQDAQAKASTTTDGRAPANEITADAPLATGN